MFSNLMSFQDNTIAATGGATVRHLVTAVFDRAVLPSTPATTTATAAAPTAGKAASELPAAVLDAYLLFQDLVQLVNADQPLWLLGIVEMTRTFGLELLESLLVSYSPLFYSHTQFQASAANRLIGEVVLALSHLRHY